MATGLSKEIRIEVSSSIGTVSAKIIDGDQPKAVLTLAHGAGAGMDHPFMNALASDLSNLGITTIRFNFPYMESKKGRPDPPAIAEKTVEAVIGKAHELFPNLPVFGAGKSFGGRMTSQRLSKDSPEFVKGIIFFGFPLHPAGAPSIDRAKHLADIKVPMLFLQGTKDTLAEMKLLDPMVKKLKGASLVKFEGADHSFKISKKVIMSELASAADRWIEGLLE